MAHRGTPGAGLGARRPLRQSKWAAGFNEAEAKRAWKRMAGAMDGRGDSRIAPTRLHTNFH